MAVLILHVQVLALQVSEGPRSSEAVGKASGKASAADTVEIEGDGSLFLCSEHFTLDCFDERAKLAAEYGIVRKRPLLAT